MTEVHAEYEKIRDTGRRRLIRLSQPKEPKVEWWTSIGPNVMWGTQETMWPISPAAQRAEATNRLHVLSQPKNNFQTGDKVNTPLFYYSCGRSSVLRKNSPAALHAHSTERVSFLAQPKQLHKDYRENQAEYLYSCGRSSPIIYTSDGAMQCGERPRTLDLAGAKQPVKEFVGNRQVKTIIPESALRAKPTERLENLANPKNRPVGPFREPQWPVSGNAKNATATPRCAELARSKSLADGYQPPKEVEWVVTRAAKRTTATSRLSQLAEPIVRASMDHVQFNPDAFLVRPTALKGVFPNRVEELAHPITR